jgi:hypothetical protein
MSKHTMAARSLSSAFRFLLAATTLLLLGISPQPADAQTSGGIWTSARELASQPTSGKAWQNVLDAAQESTQSPNASDQDDPTNVRVLAKALVYARTGQESYRQEVIEACRAVIGTEAGGRTLALGRELLAYVIAAELVELPSDLNASFRSWLSDVRHSSLSGKTLISTHEDRPNNWGTHAGASRMAASLYVGDTADLDRAAQVFHGWLGNHSAYDGFSFGDLAWQANPGNPVGINPTGSTIDGHSVDGVLPDDQRRGGGFQWPPPAENYVWEALQGAIAQAVILDRAGYDVWNWQDKALLRAVNWLHQQASFPADGDDTWIPHLVNHFYGKSFPAPSPARSGKNMGFTDWTHSGNSSAATTDPACMDGVDNDADGNTDFPDDLGCDDFTDTSEDSEPKTPEQPAQPEEPQQPTEPTKTEPEPSVPTEPVQTEPPVEPETPVQPDAPTQPDTPAAPSEPTETPTQPEEPKQPLELPEPSQRDPVTQPAKADPPATAPAVAEAPKTRSDGTSKKAQRKLARLERKLAKYTERLQRVTGKLSSVSSASQVQTGKTKHLSRKASRIESKIEKLEAKRASLAAAG